LQHALSGYGGGFELYGASVHYSGKWHCNM